MSTFGSPAYRPPRWVAFLVLAAAVVGILVAVWVFAALT